MTIAVIDRPATAAPYSAPSARSSRPGAYAIFRAAGVMELAQIWRTPFVRAGLQDLLGGTICGALSIAYCLSFAALVFSGPLQPWFGYGIAASFLSATVGALVVALRSSLPFTIAGPDNSTSAVLAVLLAALMERLHDGTDHILEPALIIMAMGTALTGILLCGLGLARAGRAIRFVPYPVIGGFLGATGWLMLGGAIQVVTDQRLTFADIDAFLSPSSLSKLMAGASIAIMLYFWLCRFRSPFALPGLLLTSVAVAHLVFLLIGVSITDAEAGGWLFKPQVAVGLKPPWTLEEFSRFPWATLPSLTGDLLAVMFVTAVSVLINTTGIELATRHEANLEGELNALGIANLLSAGLGGFVSCVSLNRTTLNYSVGATSRLSGLTVAAISAAMLAAGPGVLAYVPKFVLGGLLLYIGANLLYRWLLVPWRRLSLIEYVSLVAIALIIVEWGFIAGVSIGVVIGCATFAVSVSRVNAIKFSFDGSEYHSTLDRAPSELALLAENGREIQGMFLQSYLFFGSANALYRHVKALLAKQPECRFLLFDFRLVTGIDSSATHSFTQIKQLAHEHGARIVLTRLSRELENAFQISGFISDNIIVAPSLDHALELCEDTIIEAHRTQASEARTPRQWFTEVLGNAERADQLIQLCTRLEVHPGQIIAREGDPADSMHFILEGRVGIMVYTTQAQPVRVRSLGRHTTIGEMGLLTRQPRSATMQAELASVLYELSANAYERIKFENPALSQALLTYGLAVMSERLSFASRVIGVLGR